MLSFIKQTYVTFIHNLIGVLIREKNPCQRRNFCIRIT